MNAVREVIALVLGVLSCLSLPGGVFFLFVGLSGGLVNAEYVLNVNVRLALFAIGILPPIALLVWLRIWRGKWLA